LNPDLNEFVLAPARQTNDLPDHVLGAAYWLNNSSRYWAKDQEERFFPVEFYTYNYTDTDNRVHSGDTWFILTEDDKGKFGTRFADLLEIQSPALPVGWWNTTDPQYNPGQPRITAPMMAAAGTLDTPMNIGATIMAPPDTTAPTSNGRSPLVGVPPPLFKGDCSSSENVLDKFLGYELINADSRTFQVPYLKTALCLSYITGPQVDAWAKQKRQWLRDQHKVHGYPLTASHLWDDFEADFQAAYTDTDAKLTALQQLHDLKMVGTDIDTYIAGFSRLREIIGFRKDDFGALIKFKEGLQPRLLQEIITHHIPAPTTITQWEKAARERQTVYKELKNTGLTQNPRHPQKPAFNPTKAWAQALGLPNYVPPALRKQQQQQQGRLAQHMSQSGNNQVVPMDVDSGRMFTKLSEEERTKLQARGACFRCRRDGHMSCACPLNAQAPAHIRATADTPPLVPDDPPASTPVDFKEVFGKIGGWGGLMEHLNTKPLQEREEFLDKLQDFYPAQN
jgi:hypothetical protein